MNKCPRCKKDMGGTGVPDIKFMLTGTNQNGKETHRSGGYLEYECEQCGKSCFFWIPSPNKWDPVLNLELTENKPSWYFGFEIFAVGLFIGVDSIRLMLPFFILNIPRK